MRYFTGRLGTPQSRRLSVLVLIRKAGFKDRNPTEEHNDCTPNQSREEKNLDGVLSEDHPLQTHIPPYQSSTNAANDTVSVVLAGAAAYISPRSIFANRERD